MAKRVLLTGAFVALVAVMAWLLFTTRNSKPDNAARVEPIESSTKPSEPVLLRPAKQIDMKPVRLVGVAASPDGKWLAVGGAGQVYNGKYDNTEIVLLDAQTLQPAVKLEGHTSTISDLSFLGDGKLLASASYDNTFRVWDVTTHSPIVSLPINSLGMYQFIGVSPDRRWVATVAEADVNRSTTVRVWDALERKEARSITLNIRGALHRSIAIASGGKLLAMGEQKGGFPDFVLLYDMDGDKPVSTELLNPLHYCPVPAGGKFDLMR